MENNFKIKSSYNAIIFEKDECKFLISKAPDNDIWFETEEDEVSFDFRFSSRILQEWQTFNLFNNLLKRIIGRYYLDEDNNEYSTLPPDFINMESKTITWHSDSENDNVLQIQYLGDIIRIKITKSVKSNSSNRVRIRTDGSDYDRYYQEFTLLFQQLVELATKFELQEKQQISQSSTKKEQPTKKLSLKFFQKKGNK